MSLTDTSSAIEGLHIGTWEIDNSHSLVEFTVRHLMVSKVKGRFDRFSGAVEVAADPLDSSVRVSIDTSSINTNDSARDGHLRSPDFFDVERHPEASFESTSVAPDGDGWIVTGDLTLHGVTRSVELELEFNGVGADAWGGTRAGFSATTEISRKDFGIDLAMPIEGGGVIVGDKIKVNLEIEAIATRI